MRKTTLGLAAIAVACVPPALALAGGADGLAVLGLEPPPPPPAFWGGLPGDSGAGRGGASPVAGYGAIPAGPEARQEADPAPLPARRRARREAHPSPPKEAPLVTPAPSAAPPPRWGFGATGARGGWRTALSAPTEPATTPQPASILPRQAPIAPSAPAADESAPASGADPQFRKQEVAYSGPEAPGTIVVDTDRHFLFLVEADGRALRYGVGVGRPGFEWAGVKTVTRKAEWPEWIPPEEMLRRRPDLPKRLAGGPHNPLGARALYLGSTLYRIHGTNDPSTIGQDVSSGCIRMTNEDVIDLYDRVPVGTKVIVM